VLALIAASAVLLACNAIVGVEDVTLESPKKNIVKPPDGGDPDPDPDPPDSSKPKPDRGTLALGFIHGCARMPDGTVRCWGDNGAGQLGAGVPYGDPAFVQQALVPKPVPDIDDAIDIASGLSHTCVLHRAGTVSCWGVNTFGQLGDGTQERSPKPVRVVGLDDAISIAGGQSFMCAIRKDKTVACWGIDDAGQLGDGLKVHHRVTIGAATGVTNAISLTGATNHACAVVEGGSVLCWGGNAEGQLGIGSTEESLVPTKLTSISDVAQVAAASRFTCARQKAGKVYCWGSNDFGQLGNGSPNTDPNPSPILVPSIGDAIFLWTGFEHACVLRKAGTVACWGKADEGQLGTGTLDASATPVAVVGIPGTARAVWTGGERSCALADDGRAFCWGSNSLGQLGNGTTERALKPVQMSDFP
jgi:alpha-tubulin suppressor-like RCC1 family protein